MFFCKFYYFVYITECQSRYSIRTAIIYGNTFRFGIVQSSTREYNVRNITHTFVILLRRQQVRSGTEFHFPGLIKIQQCRTETINKAVT